MAKHGDTGRPLAGGRPTLGRRELAALAVALTLAAVAVIVALAVRGSSAAARAPVGLPASHPTTTVGPHYDGLTVTHPQTAPALALRDHLGAPVNLASYRGKAVLVTFIYTHCPDTCPLIVSQLHAALHQMSAAERAQLQIIAVSADPRGDTPATVTRFLAGREMTGQMLYLIGSAHALGAVWAHWGIASQRDASNPALVEHTALIYGISAHGRITVVYPANFTPAEIVHDARLLARA